MLSLSCVFLEGDFSWMVPFDIACSRDPSKPVYSDVLKEKSMTVTLDVKPDEWIKVTVILGYEKVLAGFFTLMLVVPVLLC